MHFNSRIFIAGHRGLVGSAIKSELEKRGFENLICRTRQELDLRDAVAVEKFFEEAKIEYVFMCAAKVGGIMANNSYRADFIYENLCIQNNVIFNSYKYRVKKLLFLGSSCIYPKHAIQPIKEDSLLTGELEYTNEPYAVAKIAGIKMCESFNIQYKTNFICIMPTNLYGNNDNFDLQSSHVLPALIRKMHLAKLLQNGKKDEILIDLSKDSKVGSYKEALRMLNSHGIHHDKVEIWGSGKPTREFLHSSDMARISIFIMQNVDFKNLTADKKEIRGAHINVGSAKEISVKELAKLIKDIVGFEGELVFNHEKPDGTMRKLMDNSKLKSLGLAPEIDLRSGIKSVYESYRNSRSKN